MGSPTTKAGSALRSGRCATSVGMRRPLLTLCCLGAVLALAGCGGGGHKLSDTAFRTRANHICSELSREEKPDLASTSKAGIDRNLRRIDSALSELQDLHPPADDEQHYGDLLRNFNRVDAFVKANEVRLIRMEQHLRVHPSDSAALARYERLVRPYVRNLELAAADATALRLRACAKGLSGGSQ
jgi:hypothetical protein